MAFNEGAWERFIFALAAPAASTEFVFFESDEVVFETFVRTNLVKEAVWTYFAVDIGAHFAAHFGAALFLRSSVFPAILECHLIWSYSCLLTFFGVLILIHGVAFHECVQVFVFVFIVESLELTIFTSSVSSESNSSLNYFRVTLLLPRVRSEVVTWTYLFSECPGTDTPTHREGRATHETKKSDHKQDTGHRFYFYLSGPQAVP